MALGSQIITKLTPPIYIYIYIYIYICVCVCVCVCVIYSVAAVTGEVSCWGLVD